MPLSLTDPRWNDLRSAYGSIEDTVTWLTEAYDEGGFSPERLGDLVNEVQHQGDTSTSMYAVAPHLIALARGAGDEAALELLITAGMMYANASSPEAVPCPDFLREEFVNLAPEGANLIAPLLPLATEFDRYKWAVAALAGFIGQHEFAHFLDGLDFQDGKFHHIWIGGAFPAEE